MKPTKETMNLISAVEYEIGSSCYNAESYNGWTDEYGCSFRYPIIFEYKDDDGEIKSWKTRLKISDYEEYLKPENVRTVCYKFGANELCIGGAVIDMLTMLEERYGLDFAKLEKEYQKKAKEKSKK